MAELDEIVIRDDTTLTGITAGNITLLEFSTLEIKGTHAGSVDMGKGTKLIVTGALAGPVDVSRGCTVEIDGALAGPLTVAETGVVLVRRNGSLAGPIVNDGAIRNFGKRAGPFEGNGSFVDEPGSYVAQPEIGPDGSHSYRL